MELLLGIYCVELEFLILSLFSSLELLWALLVIFFLFFSSVPFVFSIFLYLKFNDDLFFFFFCSEYGTSHKLGKIGNGIRLCKLFTNFIDNNHLKVVCSFLCSGVVFVVNMQGQILILIFCWPFFFLLFFLRVHSLWSCTKLRFLFTYLLRYSIWLWHAFDFVEAILFSFFLSFVLFCILLK